MRADRDLALVPSHVRTPPALLAMVLFLASELMFFGGLFGAYFFLRGQTDPWPPAGVHLDTALMGVATGLLALSSLTMHRALSALRGARRTGAVGWLATTMALGAAFLGLKVHDWAAAPFAPDSHAYGTLFFTMTGAHAVHLAVGIVLLGIVLGRMAQGAYAGGGEAPGPESIGYYWHFVDVVWVAMFATIFLVR